MATPIQSVSIVGTGNVATHLSKGLRSAGVQISGVYSNGCADTTVISGYGDIPEEDLVLVCVSDDAIAGC